MSTPRKENLVAKILCSVFVELIRSRDEELSPRRLAVFLTCYQGKEHTTGSIVAATGFSHQSVQAAVASLVSANLLTRVVKTRRGKEIAIMGHTTKGRRVLKKVRDLMAPLYPSVVSEKTTTTATPRITGRFGQKGVAQTLTPDNTL